MSCPCLGQALVPKLEVEFIPIIKLPRSVRPCEPFNQIVLAVVRWEQTAKNHEALNHVACAEILGMETRAKIRENSVSMRIEYENWTGRKERLKLRRYHESVQ